MKSHYKQILEQAKQEQQKEENVGKHTSIQAYNSETVNLCVRVPKSWRTKVKASAISHDLTLEKLVVEAIERYMEQEGW